MSKRPQELRLYGPFSAKVRGVNMNGRVFKVDAEVEDISSGGVYLRLKRPVEVGASLLVIIRFSKAWTDEVRVPTVAVRGTVLRVEPEPEGGWGVVVAITRNRFL